MVDITRTPKKTEMSHIRRGWHYVMAEPFTWLFYAFFQPARFKREYVSRGVVNRLVVLLRLAVPMFLCCYPLALLVDVLHLNSYVTLNPMLINTVIGPEIVQFLLAIALATVLSIAWSVLWGIADGIAGGIAWGIILSIAGSIGSADIRGGHLGVSGIVESLISGTVFGLRHSVILGIMGGIVGSIASFVAMKRGIGKGLWQGVMGGVVGTIAAGIVLDILAGSVLNIINNVSLLQGMITKSTLSHLLILAPIASLLAGGIAGSIAGSIAERRDVSMGTVILTIGGITGSLSGILGGLLLHTWMLSIWVWGGIVVGTVLVGILGSMVGDVVLHIVPTDDRRKGITVGLMMIAGGLFFGITSISITTTMDITMAIVLGTILGVVRPPMMSMILAVTLGIGRIENAHLGIRENLIVDLILVVCFIVGYYRIPLYPISSVSSFRAYLASRKNPSQVFTHLHRSSLYWDEHVLPPLPGLRNTLLLAAEQNIEQTLEEITFIIAERHQQIGAARAASLEIAIHDLEERQELHEIAQASQRLTDLLPQEAGLIDPRWVAPFARLHDASRDAARACSPLGWQARHLALQEMIANLKKVHPNTAFKDAQLNMRLDGVVKIWREAAQQGLKELEDAPEKTSRIDNPYNPGPALELRDSLFVGRRDLAQQLGEALARGSRRPTFLLHGERRMGKSSTLKQLPDLLGARYLPIFYDLQMRGFSANIAIFLGKTAEEIAKAMSIRGLPTRRLPYEQLQEAIRKSETEVYYQFERWLELIEPILEQADRTLLLAFDEFEKLEDAGQRGHLDLFLLLDWFRSVMQNHPRLALLFSGVRSFEDMGTNWSGYFVNVQTLKVSFLKPVEAYQLITRPIPHFPSQQVFGEQVVEAIMQVTNCHPFLVQAMCSALIDEMNVSKRTRIELPEVITAADQVLKNWGSTYFRDLWERTDKDQRACMLALSHLGKSDQLTIEQYSGLDDKTVRSALDTLIHRDIVLYEQGRYRLSVHLFRYWIERNGSNT